MKMDIFTLDKLKKYSLIKDVIIRPLKVNRDSRGILVETLKTDWPGVYNKNLPFSQNYFSKTEPNVARDEDRWHVHKLKQNDRFVVIQGEIVVALYDGRKDSPTHGSLNLFHMGEVLNDKGYFLLLIPKNVLHCFLVVSKKPAIILNFPTTSYDPKEEGRVNFEKVELQDGSFFSWNKIRKIFKLPLV